MPEQPRSGAKGLEMEEALRAYFFEAGYFVVRGVPFQLEGEDVTDIDLWLYERPAAATRRRIIVDVKNKKSPKASERIIWTRGLQAALGADGAIVATTDTRSSSKRLAKNLGIVLFDGDAVARVSSARRLAQHDNLSSLEFDDAIKRLDQSRRSSDWRVTINEARASLLTGLGAHSGNRSLAAFQFFAHEAIVAHPKSLQAELATRLSYLTAALAMISLDFVIADNAFRSVDERRAAVLNSVRYGEAEVNPRLPTVDTAVGLARKYAANGTAVARQIDLGFRADAAAIPAEIISDFVGKVSTGDVMFQIARELESASVGRKLLCFDTLSANAKSALGAFLDFGTLSREAFATSWQDDGTSIKSNSVSSHGGSEASKPTAEALSNAADSGPSADSENNGPLFASKSES